MNTVILVGLCVLAAGLVGIGMGAVLAENRIFGSQRGMDLARRRWVRRQSSSWNEVQS